MAGQQEAMTGDKARLTLFREPSGLLEGRQFLHAGCPHQDGTTFYFKYTMPLRFLLISVALTRQTFAGKVMSLLYSMLSFLPRSK